MTRETEQHMQFEDTGAEEADATREGFARSAPLDHRQSETARSSDKTGAVSAGKSCIRWWVGVAVACLVSFPIGWLLSFAALLPFYLGLFFFALFGLVLGATAYRIGLPSRPYTKKALLIGTTIIVAFAWTTSIVKEGQDFPLDMAAKTGRKPRNLGTRTLPEYRSEVADQVRSYLNEHHPPGGTPGYIRWVLTDGTLEAGSIPLVRRSLSPGQTRWTWAVRVVLSIGLLGFGVGSQTFLLSSTTERKVRAMDME